MGRDRAGHRPGAESSRPGVIDDGAWFRRGRRPTDDEIARELRDHLELEADALSSAGDDAAAAARRRFGNLTGTGEDVRAVWRWAWWDRMTGDLRLAVRTLRRTRRSPALPFSPWRSPSPPIPPCPVSSMPSSGPWGSPIPGSSGSPVHSTAPRSPLSPERAHPPGPRRLRAARTGAWPEGSGNRYPRTLRLATSSYRVPATAVFGDFFRVVGSHPFRGDAVLGLHRQSRDDVVDSADDYWHLLGRDGQTFTPFPITLPGRTMPTYGGSAFTVVGVVVDNGAIPPNTDLARSHAVLRPRLQLGHAATPARLHRRAGAGRAERAGAQSRPRRIRDSRTSRSTRADVAGPQPWRRLGARRRHARRAHHRLRQYRQPAAGAGHGAEPRTGHAPRLRREPRCRSPGCSSPRADSWRWRVGFRPLPLTLDHPSRERDAARRASISWGSCGRSSRGGCWPPDSDSPWPAPLSSASRR